MCMLFNFVENIIIPKKAKLLRTRIQQQGLTLIN